VSELGVLPRSVKSSPSLQVTGLENSPDNYVAVCLGEYFGVDQNETKRTVFGSKFGIYKKHKSRKRNAGQ
jgi:hypothetical protein